MQIIETEAIKKCQSGDVKAFGKLYDFYLKKIYDFVYYKTMHKQTAEDIVSDVFIKALDHIGSYDQQKGSFSSWLYKIARNSVIDYYRSQKEEKDINDVWDLSVSKDMAFDIDNKAKMEKVRKYMTSLDSEQRDILIMRLWQGMSHSEISEIVGKSENAVKMSYSRLIQDLRKNILLLILCFFVINI